MALWVCGGEAGCGTKYAVGLFRCPRCHNTAFYEDGDPMAKITRHGGASDKTVPAPAEPTSGAVVEDGPTPATAADPTDGLRDDPGTGVPMQAVSDELEGDGSGRALPPAPDDAYGPDAVPLEGGESSSPGSSSETSTEKPPTSPETSAPATPKRARTTGSRSSKARTGDSSARSMGGGREAGTSAADSGDEAGV